MPQSSRPGMDEVRTVFRVLGEVRDLRADRAAWQRHAIESLLASLGARQGTCLHVEHFRPGGPLKLLGILHGGWSNPANAAMWEEALRTGDIAADPQMVSAMQIPDPVAAVLRPELVPDADWYAGPLVHEFIRVTEADGHVAGWLRTGGTDEVLAFTFHRDWRDRPASERQRNVLRLFAEELRLLWQEGKLPMHEPTGGPHLSGRERQVLERLAQGDSVRQAALALHLSHRTVEDHVKSLHRKFGVRTRGELLARYLNPDAGPVQ